MASGVVQAAREVAKVQNRFVDYTAPFGAQVDKMKAEKAAARKAKQDANSKHLSDANKYFRKLKDIDYSGYSNEEIKIIKDWSLKKRQRMWELSSAFATYNDKGSAEAQLIQDEMNSIINAFENVDAQNDSRLDLAKQYNIDIKGGEYGSDILSLAPQNNTALANTSMVTQKSFTSLDDDGNMGWDVDGETIGVNDAGNYYTRSAELLTWAGREMDQALKRKDPYTEQDIAFKRKQINSYLNADGALMGVLYDDYFDDYINDDIKDKFDDAWEAGDTEALKTIKDEVAGMISTAISEQGNQAAETYRANNPDKPKRVTSELTQTKRDHLKPLEDMAADPNYVAKIGADGGGFYKFVPTMRGTTVNVFLMTDEFGAPVQDDNGKFKTLTIKQYANQLGVSERTVRKKLGI
jgi:hypothetical protein